MRDILELVFIIDRSGSMSRLESDTIGGFNSVIEKQKSLESKEVLVSTVLFDDRTEVLYNRVRIKDVKPMNEETYFVRGTTALLDAVGGAIDHIKRVHDFLGEEDKPSKTMFVITTDGLENASIRHTHARVSSLISQQTELGWEFLYLGANVDAHREAKSMGIKTSHATNYMHDDKGVKNMYDAAENAIRDVRTAGYLKKSWNKEVTADYNKRSNKNK
jgi:uncharacterized protein YegL